MSLEVELLLNLETPQVLRAPDTELDTMVRTSLV
jgi:hypothetical protein